MLQIYNLSYRSRHGLTLVNLNHFRAGQIETGLLSSVIASKLVISLSVEKSIPTCSKRPSFCSKTDICRV
jgi:hypothetical protein